MRIKTKCKNNMCKRTASQKASHGLCQKCRAINKGLFCSVVNCKEPVCFWKTMLCKKHQHQINKHGKILKRTCRDKNEIIDQIFLGKKNKFLKNNNTIL
jgi:hypothetical protein